MRSGRMTERITVKNETITRGEFGEQTRDWDLRDRRLWAEVRFVSAKERFNSDRTIAITSAVFFVWKNNFINEKSRISYDGDIFKVTGIKKMRAKGGLEVFGESIE